MNKKQISIPTALLLMLLVAATCIIICTIAYQSKYDTEIGTIRSLYGQYFKLAEAKNLVDRYFVGDKDEKKIEDGIVGGYIDGLGDRWSKYYSAEDTVSLNEYTENSYVGIGVTVTETEAGEYQITKVTKDGPAYNEGIAAGDIITFVGDTDVKTLADVNGLVDLIRGEEGTRVTVTFRRGQESFTKTIKRHKVFNEGVEARMLDGKIGYVVIDNFETNIDKEFIEKVNGLMDEGAKGLVFDVRFNGGGYVSVLSEMLDILLPEGTVMSMTYKDGKTIEYRSDAKCLQCPMAVLTNEYSISAAEFFAAALQEYGVATVVGDRTCGKGFAQSLFTMSDGSSVNISIARYYTPKGVSLAGVGITPDIEISLSEEDFYNFYYLEDEQDTQLMAAVNAVRAQIG